MFEQQMLLRNGIFFLACALAALAIGLAFAKTLAVLVLFIIGAMAFGYVGVYNVRVARARRLIDEVAAVEPIEAATVGVLVPGRFWNGSNGALVAVTRTALISATVEVRQCRIMGRAPIEKCTAKLQGQSRTSTLEFQGPGFDVAIRTNRKLALNFESVIDAASRP